MSAHWQGRPLKSWRYIGVYGPEVMLCLLQFRIGRARQTAWAVWDRVDRRLEQGTKLGSGGLRLEPGGAELRDSRVRLDLRLREAAGVEVVCPSGVGYAWTRKQGGIPVVGRIEAEGRIRQIEARAVVDDTAAYYPRHTRWRWCAGVGASADGRELAWNLVSGVNDPPVSSERTVWVNGQPRETPPCVFSEDLMSVDRLRFAPEAVLERRQNLVLVRSRYRQPFGTFRGELPGGIILSEGFGVMEEHDAWW